MASIFLHGLKNCDTCRKALKALEAAGKDVTFHDVRADVVMKAQIQSWAKSGGWETLLNTRSTTWRGLSAADKENPTEAKAVRLMAEYPTLIKRPVIEAGGKIYVGWSKDTQAAILK